MSLKHRQQQLYTHRCNVWRASRTISSGLPGEETYTLVATGVPCYYEASDNIDAPIDGLGRVRRDMILTADTVHFEIVANVQNQDVIKNVSLTPAGAQSAEYGVFARLEGAPRNVLNSSRRHPNKKQFLAYTIEKPPAGVS